MTDYINVNDLKSILMTDSNQDVLGIKYLDGKTLEQKIDEMPKIQAEDLNGRCVRAEALAKALQEELKIKESEQNQIVDLCHVYEKELQAKDVEIAKLQGQVKAFEYCVSKWSE